MLESAEWAKNDEDTQLPPGIRLSKEWEPKTREELDKIKRVFKTLNYRGCIGALIFLALATIYDINYAVTKLSKFVGNPGLKHYECLAHLSRYLRKHPNFALRFYHKYEDSPIFEDIKKIKFGETYKTIPLTLTYYDSSWQDCPDTGRSTGSFLILHQGGVIDYNSFLPVPVAQSSAEAEYNAGAIAAMASAHTRYLDDDFENLGRSVRERKAYDESRMLPACLLSDSQSCIAISNSYKNTPKTRHIERPFHYLREGTMRKKHKSFHIAEENQLADIGTKAPEPTKFWNWTKKIFTIIEK